jgi:DNA sulfur modification protein DndB
MGSLVRVDASKEIRKEFKNRSRKNQEISIRDSELSQHEKDGWVVKKPGIRSIRIKREKLPEILLEDRIWTIIHNLNPTFINFQGEWDPDDPTIRRIDVVGVFEEFTIAIECKYRTTLDSGLKDDINSFASQKKEINGGIKKQTKLNYDTDKHELFQVFAISGCPINTALIKRAKSQNVALWSDPYIDYFETLAQLLGPAAQYIIRSHLSGDQKLSGSPYSSPAIRINESGLTAYLFTAPPDVLLKICTVPSRVLMHEVENDSEDEEETEIRVPGYQRLLSGSRLNDIRKFIDIHGGHFPNSIIISFNEVPIFEASKSHDIDFGKLIMPWHVGAAHIIDGQHRLYGYAKTEKKHDHLLPVFAYVKINTQKQADIFVRVNATQKPVERNLIWDLHGDLLWNDSTPSEKEKAFISRITKDLNSRRNSPFYHLIKIPSHSCQIGLVCPLTMRMMCTAIKKSNIFKTISEGDFTDKTLKQVTNRIIEAFNIIKTEFEEEWRKGYESNICNNNIIPPLFIVISQIWNNIYRQRNSKINRDDWIAGLTKYLKPLIEYLRNQDLGKMKKASSEGQWIENSNKFEREINKVYKEYVTRIPLDELKSNGEEEEQETSEQDDRIKTLEVRLRKLVMDKLKNAVGESWWKSRITEDAKRYALENAEKRISKHPYEHEKRHNAEWLMQFLTFGQLLNIIKRSDNWDLFKEIFGDSDNFTRKLLSVLEVRNGFDHVREISEIDYKEGINSLDWMERCLDHYETEKVKIIPKTDVPPV